MDYRVYTLKHSAQSYDTAGDWKVRQGKLREIKVSDMMNEDYAFLVGLHEQIEAWLCLKRGIKQITVDAFDKAYEAAREKGIKAPCGCKPTETSEPGHDRHAPYGDEHKFAEKIERMMAKEMGINWDDYSKTVESL
jgi:hypothetical protein